MAESNLPPVEITIFGASGDLTWRKLTPALYHLHLGGLIPEKYAIYEVDFKSTSLEDMRKCLLEVWESVVPSDFPNYVSGTGGPPSVEILIAQDGRRRLQPVFLEQQKSGGGDDPYI